MYNKLRSVILLAYKEEMCKREILDCDARQDIENDINEVIEFSLRNYVDQSEHFSKPKYLKYDECYSVLKLYGYYNHVTDFIMLDENFRCFYSIASLNLLETLKESVNVFLHEHRHCHQYKTNMDIINHPLSNKNNPEYVYENSPLELDANKYAAMYELEAVEWIIDSVESWFNVKYTRDIVEADIRDEVRAAIENYYNNLPEEEIENSLAEMEKELEEYEMTQAMLSMLDDPDEEIEEEEEIEEITIDPDEDIKEWFRQYEEQFGEW